MKYALHRHCILSVCLVFLMISCQSKKQSSSQPEHQASLLDSLSSNYRLKPDGRFLLAVADIHSVLTGEEKGKAKAVFHDGRWEIMYRATAVGSVPELPDFSDYMGVLEKWASILQEEHPLHLVTDSDDQGRSDIDEAIRSYHPIEVAQAVNEIGQLWKQGSHHSSYLVQATRGLLTLTMEQLDKFEIADEVPSQALAMLAVTKALTHQHMEREECLLSYAMEYSEHSLRIATSLPDRDPVRLYVRKDDDQLMKLSESTDGTHEAMYLSLLRLADKGDIKPFWNWLETHFSDEWYSLLVLKAGLDLGTFSISPAMAEALPRVVLVTIAQDAALMPEVTQVAGKMKSQPLTPEKYRFLVHFVDAALKEKTTTLMNSFESGIKVLDTRYSGPFLDAKTYRAFYEGYFFSAFYVLGLHYLDALSSIETANTYAILLGKTERGIASDIQRWFGDLAKSKEGKLKPLDLIDDLTLVEHLGAPALTRTVEELEKYFSYGDVSILFTMKQLVNRLDSRPSHLLEFTNQVYTDLLDLKLAEQLGTHFLKTSSSLYPYTQAWLARFQGKQQVLARLLDSSSFDFESRQSIVHWLEFDTTMSQENLIARYSDLVELKPDDYGVSMQFGKYLNKIGKFAEARAVLKRWLDRKVPTDGLEVVFMRSEIARSYYNQQRYDEAWEISGPNAESWQAGAMQLASDILYKLHRVKEAETMAQKIVARYPDGFDRRMHLVAFYWQEGRYDEAGQVLKESPGAIRMSEWQYTVGPKFAEIFSGEKEKDVLPVIDGLLRQGFPPQNIQALSDAFSRAKKHALALAITSRMRAGGQQQLAYWTYCYKEMKALRGDAAALDWLKKMIPQEQFSVSSMIFYNLEEFDLLWNLIKEPEKGEYPDFVWLLRAASVGRSGMAKNPHWEELRAHYEHVGDENYYDVIGKHLVGLVDEEDVVALATTPKKVCEIAYYVGLRAQAEGRFEAASDWYRLSIETGLANNGEYRWSFDVLYSWKNSGKNLKTLAATTEKESVVEDDEEDD